MFNSVPHFLFKNLAMILSVEL